MQQIPRYEQHLYLQLCATMGHAYCLHTPEAIGTALRRGLNTVDHRHRAGPFYPSHADERPTCRDRELQSRRAPGPAHCPAWDPPATRKATGPRWTHCSVRARRREGRWRRAAEWSGTGRVSRSRRWSRGHQSARFRRAPLAHPRNMTVGGSKGSICGNFAIEEADLLVAIGTRCVCQSDCSRTGYLKREPGHQHQHGSRGGDALRADDRARRRRPDAGTSQCVAPAAERAPPAILNRPGSRLRSEAPGVGGLQTRAIRRPDPARRVLGRERPDATCGHQARNRLGPAPRRRLLLRCGRRPGQRVSDRRGRRLGQTFTETGASYMGFAVSSLLATALARQPFYGLRSRETAHSQ